MMSILPKVSIFVLAIFVTLNSFAREGFSQDSSMLPLAVRNTWESVLLIVPSSRGKTGSAFVVREEYLSSLPEKKILYILASDHVIKANCGEKIGACNSFVLTGSHSLNLRSMQLSKTNTKDLIIKDKIFIVRRNAQADMSLIKVIVDADKFKDIKPIPHDKSCEVHSGDAVFVIGFPATIDRKATDALPIEDQDLVTRRWSKGYILQPLKSDNLANDSTSYWTGTTADALDGNSGGPAINSEGKFWGVLDSAAISNDGGYTGNDKKTADSFHGLVTRCELVQDFINLRELSFLEEIKASKINPGDDFSTDDSEQ